MSKRTYTRKDGTSITVAPITNPLLRKTGLIHVKHICPSGWGKNVVKAFSRFFSEEIKKKLR